MPEREPQFNKPEIPKPELPTGEARKLEELTREKWREHLLLFSQVKNKVLEVNPDVYIPLKLEEGKPSPLGLFAEAAFRKKPRELPRGKHALEFWWEHKRSALLGRVIFADKEGRIYRDIDLKGIGLLGIGDFVQQRAEVSSPGAPRVPMGSFGREGLLDRDIAFFDRQISEEFLEAGIRTHRVLAIIELKELIVGGDKISLEEAERRGILDKNFHPVVEVRAFGTKTRFDDLFHMIRVMGEDKSILRLLFEDAKKLVSQELDRKKTLSNSEYLQWFAKTLGRNIGLMHKNGWLHNYILGHNITLDCRIVDLDSITQITHESESPSEFRDTREAFESLLEALGVKEPKIDNYLHLLYQSYDAAFPPEERKRYFASIKEKG